jgi:hypothetical protein
MRGDDVTVESTAPSTIKPTSQSGDIRVITGPYSNPLVEVPAS